MRQTTGGPGWYRMHSRLGQEYMEEMRQRVVRDQAAALAPSTEPVARQDRESYRDYPAPRLPKKKGRR